MFLSSEFTPSQVSAILMWEGREIHTYQVQVCVSIDMKLCV